MENKKMTIKELAEKCKERKIECVHTKRNAMNFQTS